MKTHRFLLPLLFACLAAQTAGAADLPPPGTNTISGVVRFTNADTDILDRLGPSGNEGMTSFSIFACASAKPSSP